MKWTYFLLVSTICISTSGALAAEKSKVLIQLDATRSAVETAAGKAEGNKDATADLARARAALKYADESHTAGKSMFGFGDINPETEKEIKLSVDIADLATATALSRVELVRATAELEAIEKQFTAVKTKLKLFEDRKAELVKLRQEVAACQKTTNELEILKVEKTVLTTKMEQLTAERSRADKLKIEQFELSKKLDELKAENSRLTGLLEKQQPEVTDPKKSITKKP